MPNTQPFAAQVEQAFIAAKAGNFEPSSQLQQLGESIVPLLKPYLSDPDENIRRQAIALLGSINGDAALPLLTAALADPSADLQQRASLILYTQYDPSALAADTAIAQALKQNIENGNESAPAVLLLGYFPGNDTIAVLRKLRESEALTEVFTWTPAVPVRLAADIALSRLGEQDARVALLDRIEKGDLNELSFLLYSLLDIDSPKVLHALKTATFNDEREITGDMPSGIKPQIRLQDLAVSAFVKYLDMPTDFEIAGDKRYSAAEKQQVEDYINAHLPR